MHAGGSRYYTCTACAGQNRQGQKIAQSHIDVPSCLMWPASSSRNAAQPKRQQNQWHGVWGIFAGESNPLPPLQSARADFFVPVIEIRVRAARDFPRTSLKSLLFIEFPFCLQLETQCKLLLINAKAQKGIGIRLRFSPMAAA